MRRFLRVAILLIVGGGVLFAAWGIYETNRQAQLEADLKTRGKEVMGEIVDKSKSTSPSSSSSYSIHVKYDVNGTVITLPFSIRGPRYETLSVGDGIRVTTLPNHPEMSQLTEVLGTTLNARPFTPR